MFRTALRNVFAHKARLSMTVLAVMLGVAFVSGTLVFADTLSNAFRNQSAKSYDDVAVAVTSHADPDNPKEEPGLSGKVLDRISAVDGVAGVYGRVEGFAGVADPNGSSSASAGPTRAPTSPRARTARTPRTRSPTAPVR
ncbi:hypothetical protein SVIOM342S_09730 [Streptomyces violaceorubidus]